MLSKQLNFETEDLYADIDYNFGLWLNVKLKLHELVSH